MPVLMVLGFLSFAVISSSAQLAHAPDSHDESVVLSKLFPPTYPGLARQARITGNVDLALHIRPDGSVETAVVVGGHPILRDAALDSARRSSFECGGCGQVPVTYALTYQFKIAEGDPPQDCAASSEIPPPPTTFDESQHLVTVFAWGLWTCDPSADLIRVRAAKCLYLWKCGVRDPL
jgi:TonB family protein